MIYSGNYNDIGLVRPDTDNSVSSVYTDNNSDYIDKLDTNRTGPVPYCPGLAINYD